jgi:hypothetical protein
LGLLTVLFNHSSFSHGVLKNGLQKDLNPPIFVPFSEDCNIPPAPNKSLSVRIGDFTVKFDFLFPGKKSRSPRKSDFKIPPAPNKSLSVRIGDYAPLWEWGRGNRIYGIVTGFFVKFQHNFENIPLRGRLISDYTHLHILFSCFSSACILCLVYASCALLFALLLFFEGREHFKHQRLPHVEDLYDILYVCAGCVCAHRTCYTLLDQDLIH